MGSNFNLSIFGLGSKKSIFVFIRWNSLRANTFYILIGIFVSSVRLSFELICTQIVVCDAMVAWKFVTGES